MTFSSDGRRDLGVASRRQLFQTGAGAHGAALRRRQSLAAQRAAGATEPRAPKGRCGDKKQRLSTIGAPK